MREKQSDVFNQLDDLYIDIFLCGYEEEGESSVFILYTLMPVPMVLYTVVIDCYENENINCTKRILEEKSKYFGKKIWLDMLIWTHPHDDHTKGIESIIRKYCNDKTKIITANVANSAIEFSEMSKSLIRYLTSINYRKKKRWNISAVEKMGDLLQSVQFTGNKELIKELEIKCIAPCPDIISQEITEEFINNVCVGIVIMIKRNDGNLNFMFAADMEEKTIREVVREQEAEGIPNQYAYIKIPHHGGKSGALITGLLDMENKSELAASTIYAKTMRQGVSYNPNKDVLKRYKKYINEIDLTTNVFEDERGVGVIHINYDLGNKRKEVHTYGKAVRDVC